MIDGPRGPQRRPGVSNKKAGHATGLFFNRSFFRTTRSLAPGERRHDAHEDARLVVTGIGLHFHEGAARVGAGELREDREIAGRVVSLHSVVDDLTALAYEVAIEIEEIPSPIVAPRVTSVEGERELVVDSLRVVHLGVLSAFVGFVEIVRVPLLEAEVAGVEADVTFEVFTDG